MYIDLNRVCFVFFYFCISGRSTAKRVQKTIKPSAFRLPPTTRPEVASRQPVTAHSAVPPTATSAYSPRSRNLQLYRPSDSRRTLSFEGSEFPQQRRGELLPRPRNAVSKIKATTVRADYDYYDEGPTKVMEPSKSTKVI